MKINYKKPRQIRAKSYSYNLLTDTSFTITMSFKVEKTFKQDKKIGFLGIPGKNFGISYDYEVNTFVFEFWTKDDQGDLHFNCHKDYDITIDEIRNGIVISIAYDLTNKTFKLYKNYDILFDTIEIKKNHKLLREYYKQPIYIGCHKTSSLLHGCYTEMDIQSFTVYNDVNNLTNDKMICNLDLSVDENTKIINDTTGNGNYSEFIDVEEFTEMVDFDKTKQKLNSVGCGFCLAKWTQVTMHLHNGTTHSCHHPEPHKVKLGELKRNHTALHNSLTKKQARKEMLSGERPKECNYCWNVEDNSNSFSDRIFKSAEPWSEPHFDEIATSDWRDNYVPKYVEVNFSNTCNFKCAYCGPEYSSKWMEEINEFGAYNLKTFQFNGTERMDERKTRPFRHSDKNPYVEAFWKWWPELYRNLDTFRITGGEPLLSKDTWKVLDHIIETESPNTNLKLSINTNLGVTDDLIDRLIEKLTRIINEKRVKEIVIFTSCDAYGKQSEFTRYGMNFERLFSNIDKILTCLETVTIVVMSTFNMFSVFSYEELIKKIHKFKIKHFNVNRVWNSAIILDTSYLRHPPFMSFRMLKDYINVEVFERWIKYMKFNSTYRSLNFYKQQTIDDVGFSTQEIEKITRIRDIFVSDFDTPIEQFDDHKKDLVLFLDEYQKRRGYNWEEYFPELKDFFQKIVNEN